MRNRAEFSNILDAIFLLNIPGESCQMKRTELIAAPLSETRSLLGENPEVCCLVVQTLATQVGHSQTIAGHLLYSLGRGEDSNSLYLQVEN